MKIILSPAKKMNIKLDILEAMGLPMFIDRSMDGVTPYRLEMQAKAVIENEKNLYDYWGDMLYKGVRDEKGIIINLESKEYSKCIERYLSEEDTYISITFCELSIENPEEIKKFNRLGYVFREDLSTKIEYVFERRL